MLNKIQKIAISKNFIISMLFVCLLLTAFGMNVEDSYAVDLNQTCDGISMESDIEDKLENSQVNEVLEVDENVGGTLNAPHIVEGRTFQDIQNVIDGAQAGDRIYLVGEYTANGRESTINLTKDVVITSKSSATLNGQKVSGILRILGDAHGAGVSNIKFINANREIGSAINILAKNVLIYNCTFENNHCDRTGVVSSQYSLYGAENLTVRNCVFRNNSAYTKNFENATTAGALGVYGMNTRVINCTFDSNWIKGKGTVFGGALQIGLDEPNYKAMVYNCTFINNKAISINGYSHGGAGCVRNGVDYYQCKFINNSAGQGGALTFHASGKLKDCILINNTATKLYGGAVSTGFLYDSMNLEINNCYFEGNDAPKGGAIQVAGLNVTILNSNFTKNHADTVGGALNIEALNVKIQKSAFNSNVAEVDGGAIYTVGNDTVISQVSFISNEARPDSSKLNDGLGGAIYINSTKAKISNSNFYYNKARNGSAVYYDSQGNELILENNTLFENQAWVYLLPIYAHDIYYGQTEELKSIIHGGNNIAKYGNLAVSNAIYNAADYSCLSIDGESPVNGATNSGRLYQDDREYNMEILMTVKKDDGSLVYNKTLNSNYLGEVSDELNDLEPGKYYVTARHSEDTYYKSISNTTSFTVIPKIDSQVRKASSSESYNYNDTVVWTLNITNNGPNKATNVTVRDVLPKGLIYLGDDTNHAYDPKTGILYIGDVDVNQTIIVNIYARVNKTGNITNEANVTSKEYDINMTNNHDEAKITVPPTCDLAVEKTVNNTNPNYRDIVKWTVTVRNNGPDIAHDVVLTDILPKSLIYIHSSGSYNNATGKWNIGTLGVNKQVKLEIICRVNATGTIQNDVSVKGREIDRDESNNNDSCKINVNESSDLAIEKSIDLSSANFGDEITWKLVITNNGPSKATGVKINDTLPDGLIYLRSTLPRGSYSNGIIDVGNLAVGGRLTYTITCKVNRTGTIVNRASVSGNQYDYDLSNNKDEADILINLSSDLEVIKTVNVSNPRYGDNITWTITVKNNGPNTELNAKAFDVLPKGLVWISDDGNGKYNHVTGKWSIGRIDRYTSVQLNIICRVNVTGVIQNNVSVNGSRFDYDFSNNKDDASINVSKTADVGITKLVNRSKPAYGDTIKWTLIAHNYGPDNATSVVVDDILPNGLVLMSVNASKGIYDNGIWSICCLENGEEQRLEIICKVNKTGTITNFASITASEVDLNPSNNEANKSIKVPSTVDLEVTKHASNNVPYFNDNVTWMISIRNNGPDKATNIVLTDILDEGLVLINCSSTAGTFENGKWMIPSLNKGFTEYLNVTCTVKKLGEIINEAYANCSQVDRNMSNNNDSEIITVSPISDLSVVKLVNVSNPNYGDLIKWSIIVANNGPNDATGVNVMDIMPSGVEIVESSDFIDNGNWYIGNLAVNEVVELDITCKVIETGIFENVAVVSGDEHDPHPENNRDVEHIDVPPACDLSITKTVSKYHYKVGDIVDYSIKVSNNGPDVARNVKVNEIPDKLLTLKGVSATKGSFDESDNVWKIDSLDDGECAELYIRAMAAGEGAVRNIVSATSDTFDYNLDNNKDEVVVDVNESDEISNSSTNSPENMETAKINKVLSDNHVTGNPLVILMILAMFFGIFAGGNISKKR